MRGMRNERSSTLSARTLPSRAKPSPSGSPPENSRGASAREGAVALVRRQTRAGAQPPRDRASAVGADPRARRAVRLANLSLRGGGGQASDGGPLLGPSGDG